MNEKLNKNAKVEQLTRMFLSREEEKGLIVKDPLLCKSPKILFKTVDLPLLFYSLLQTE